MDPMKTAMVVATEDVGEVEGDTQIITTLVIAEVTTNSIEMIDITEIRTNILKNQIILKLPKSGKLLPPQANGKTENAERTTVKTTTATEACEEGEEARATAVEAAEEVSTSRATSTTPVNPVATLVKPIEVSNDEITTEVEVIFKIIFKEEVDEILVTDKTSTNQSFNRIGLVTTRVKEPNQRPETTTTPRTKKTGTARKPVRGTLKRKRTARQLRVTSGTTTNGTPVEWVNGTIKNLNKNPFNPSNTNHQKKTFLKKTRATNGAKRLIGTRKRLKKKLPNKLKFPKSLRKSKNHKFKKLNPRFRLKKSHPNQMPARNSHKFLINLQKL